MRFHLRSALKGNMFHFNATLGPRGLLIDTPSKRGADFVENKGLISGGSK